MSKKDNFSLRLILVRHLLSSYDINVWKFCWSAILGLLGDEELIFNPFLTFMGEGTKIQSDISILMMIDSNYSVVWQ